MALLDDPERVEILRRAVVARSPKDGSNLPTGRGENTLNLEKLMTRLFEEVSGQSGSDRESLKRQHGSSEPALDCPFKRAEVMEMMGDAIIQQTDNLDV